MRKGISKLFFMSVLALLLLLCMSSCADIFDSMEQNSEINSFEIYTFAKAQMVKEFTEEDTFSFEVDCSGDYKETVEFNANGNDAIYLPCSIEIIV